MKDTSPKALALVKGEAGKLREGYSSANVGSSEGRSAEAKPSETSSSAGRMSLLFDGGALVSLRPGHLPLESLVIDLPELSGDVS